MSRDIKSKVLAAQALIAEILADIDALEKEPDKKLDRQWIKIGDVAYLSRSGVIAAGRREYPLSPQQRRIIDLLIQYRGSIVGREEMNVALGLSPDTATRTAAMHVCSLRKLLPADAITTVYGGGYRLRSQDMITTNNGGSNVKNV